jgi:hypothetical protein
MPHTELQVGTRQLKWKKCSGISKEPIHTRKTYQRTIRPEVIRMGGKKG